MLTPTMRYCVGECPTLEAVYEKLAKFDWTRCTGMRCGELIFLHDGGDEYAVVVEHEGQLIQIETFTVPWFKSAEEFVTEAQSALASFKAGTPYMRLVLRHTLEPVDQHETCWACA